jgi:hypothetical protein
VPRQQHAERIYRATAEPIGNSFDGLAASFFREKAL